MRHLVLLEPGIAIPECDDRHVRVFDIVDRTTGRDILRLLGERPAIRITDPAIIDLITNDDLFDRSGAPNLILQDDCHALSLVCSRDARATVSHDRASLTSRIPWNGHGRVFVMADGACPR